MRIWPAAIALALCGGPALAQGEAAIRAALQRENAGCEITSLRIAHRGALPGLPVPAVVATYGVEGCGGGNNWAAALVVLARRPDGLQPLPLPPALRLPAVVARAEVRRGRILVTGLDYAPADPRCCPSLQRRVSLALQDGQVTAYQLR